MSCKHGSDRKSAAAKAIWLASGLASATAAKLMVPAMKARRDFRPFCNRNSGDDCVISAVDDVVSFFMVSP